MIYDIQQNKEFFDYIQTQKLTNLNKISKTLCYNYDAKQKLVLLRHGESEQNAEERFTGWENINLSQKGIEEAELSGIILKDQNLDFEKVQTSKLCRTIQTWQHLSKKLNSNESNITICSDWQLNERHQGILQGMRKSQAREIQGEANVENWRNSQEQGPPELSVDDVRHPQYSPDYKYISIDDLPAGESLKMCIDRIYNCLFAKILPDVKSGKNVIIVSHNNVIRGIVQLLKKIPITECDKIPNAVPYVLYLNEEFIVVKDFYLKSKNVDSELY